MFFRGLCDIMGKMKLVVINMYVNGIVIQKYVDNNYKGIDGSGFSESTGENWYFNNDEHLSELFEPFYDEHIGI